MLVVKLYPEEIGAFSELCLLLSSPLNGIGCNKDH